MEVVRNREWSDAEEGDRIVGNNEWLEDRIIGWEDETIFRVARKQNGHGLPIPPPFQHTLLEDGDGDVNEDVGDGDAE